MKRLTLAAAVFAGLSVLVGCAQPKVTRYGWVIGVKADKLDHYKRLHADCWPGVLKQIRDCNIRNYSIYCHKMDNDEYYLFSYLEYVGDDFAADMERMAADATTQRWWKETDPCQFAVKHRREGEFWAEMEEVFHCD